MLVKLARAEVCVSEYLYTISNETNVRIKE